MSPKSKKQFDEIRQKSRAKIMEVALELFAQNGYHQTSISQIAKSAAISKGLMYNYFASKEELLTEIVMEAVQEFEKMSDTILKMPNPPEEKLKWITESAIELVQKDVKHWRLLTSLGLQTDVLTKLRDILRIKSENGLELAELLFFEMGFENPRQEAYLYGAFLDGILLHYVMMQSLDLDYPITEVSNFIYERYNIK